MVFWLHTLRLKTKGAWTNIELWLIVLFLAVVYMNISKTTVYFRTEQRINILKKMGAGCLTIEEIGFLFFKYTKEGTLECYWTGIESISVF